jgi:hypothetical protein
VCEWRNVFENAQNYQREGLPEQAGGRFGVSFEFDDDWLEARFHLTKEDAERQAARVGESEPVPRQKSMSRLLVSH